MNSAPVPTSGTPEDVCLKIDRERQRGRKVVFTNGVFDILHAGHVDLLRRAAELGDLLVVAVNSDASARRLKGRNRPINSERDRLALVAAMDPVDYVLLLEDDDPSHLIRRLRPHLHVKGEDYRGEPLPEMSAVAEVGGSVEFIPLARDLSTTRVIDRIVGSRALENLVPESVSA